MFWISWKPPSRTPKPLEAAAVPSVWVIRSFTLTLLRKRPAHLRFISSSSLETTSRSSPTSQEFRQCETSAVAVSDRAFGSTAWSFCSGEESLQSADYTFCTLEQEVQRRGDYVQSRTSSPRFLMDRPAASSIRTTRNPASPSLIGVSPLTMQLAKYSNSTRRASSSCTFGAHMSPER